MPAGEAINVFNFKLKEQLKKLVIEIDKNDKQAIKKIFFIPQPVFKKIILFIPAIIGYIIHFPLYYAAVISIKNRANDHYDSILVGLLFLFYPLYVLAMAIAIYFFTNQPVSWLLLIAIPFTAWATLQLKKQID
jgi:hypothetical protein